jgi:signal transduction histidine kinase
LKLQAQGLLLVPPQSLDATDAARVKHSLDVVNRQVSRLDKLIGNLLDVSRIGAGRLMLDLAETDLCSVVNDVTRQFEAELTRHNCTLVRELPGELTGYWDSLRIDQVVTNLIANAIKYGGGKPIELRLEGQPDVARLTVRDRGIGIAPEDQPRIFGRFERAAGLAYGGLGLGLFISRQIVLAHGGSIRVESTPNLGSVFTVELPRRSAAAAAGTGA